MRKTLTLPPLALIALALLLGACKKEPPAGNEPAPATSDPVKAPPAATKAASPAASATGAATLEGAKALLSQFLKPGADHVALSKMLQPTSADYKQVFVSPEMATKAEQVYAGLWKMIERMPIKPKEGQDELLLWKATTDELKAGTGDASKFPGGYKTAAPHLKPGLTLFRFKFVKKGETLGMAFDGLYNLGGRWVLMPKPWRIAR